MPERRMDGFKKNLRLMFNRPSAEDRARFAAAVAAGDIAAAEDFMARYHGIGNRKTAEGPEGRHPLFIAAAQGHIGLMQRLIAAGANTNAPETNGDTPLHAAARGGHSSAIILLCKRGAEVDAARRDGATPLAIAAQNGQSAAVRLLLDYGADAEMRAAQDLAVYTPLHRAADNDDAATVKTLLKHADVFKRGDYNRFYFQRALHGAKPQARAALKEWAAAQKHKPS
jgi:ankyrin repeat protein